jgi:hypothetical protein
VSEKMKIDELKWADAMDMEFHLVPYTNNDLIGVLVTTGETSELEKNRKTIDALAEQLGVPARIYYPIDHDHNNYVEKVVALTFQKDGVTLVVGVPEQTMKYYGENVRAFWLTQLNYFIDYIKKSVITVDDPYFSQASVSDEDLRKVNEWVKTRLEVVDEPVIVKTEVTRG